MRYRCRLSSEAGAVIALGAAAIVAGGVVSAQSDPPGQCCFTQVCGEQSVQHCIPNCGPNARCMGQGGCNPIWAQAQCFVPP